MFDFDGVLVDSEPIHFECWREILAPYGFDFDWQTYNANCIGVSERAMLTFLCERMHADVTVDHLMQEYPRKKDLFRERMAKPDALGEEASMLIERLRRSYKLGLVTSSGQAEVEPILRAAGVFERFDAAVFGDDVKRHKPAPDSYLLALERLGVTKALVVEDSAAGVAAGRAAGLDVLQVPVQADLCRLVSDALALDR